MYLDSAYIAKFYVNESDSAAVRRAIRGADVLVSSMWALGEVACAFHRHLREGSLSQIQFRELLDAFRAHVGKGLWTLLPVSESVMQRMISMIRTSPASVYLRTGDAIHLASAQAAGEQEIWTNDRHLLAAAPHFGVRGKVA